jgi:hypothetical protein
MWTLVLMLFVDWWISAHESYLHCCAWRLGLCAKDAPAPGLKAKKGAASGAGSTASKKQQQQQGRARKQGRKRQAGKADSRGRSDHSNSASSSSQAPSSEQSSEASRKASKDQNANSPPHQLGSSRAASEDSDGEWEVQLRPLLQEQQQQQQPAPPGSSSSAQRATLAQPAMAAAPSKGELQRNVPQLLCQGYIYVP